MTAAPSTRFLLHPSPIGDVLIVTTDEGIVTLHPLRDPLEDELERLSPRSARRPRSRPTTTRSPARRRASSTSTSPANARSSTSPSTGASSADSRAPRSRPCGEIPYGETAGYGEVAAHAGSPRAARAVGTACATTPFSIVVPVHRVVRADGSIGEYGGHPEDKAFLLDLERAAGE